MISTEQANKLGEGRTIAVRERNGYDDSDFEAFYLTDEGTFKWVETGSTRFAGGFVARVDATPEVVAQYRAARDQALEAHKADVAEVEARTIHKGDEVTIVKGRTRGKQPVEAGTQGTVVWIGVDQWKSTRHYTFYRVGVKVEDETIWVAQENVRRVGHETEDLPFNNEANFISSLWSQCWPIV